LRRPLTGARSATAATTSGMPSLSEQERTHQEHPEPEEEENWGS
jgi:hypothetical protein